ncbi:hypothetical protein COOONC_25997 [Cooperia oncophora]
MVLDMTPIQHNLRDDLIKKCDQQLMRSLGWAIFIQCCLIIWIFSWLTSDTGDKAADTKYVGLHLVSGRLGNQLFHLISGYAIAKSIGRVHYLPYEKEHMEVVLKYLELFKRVFPALERTYILGQIGINATVVPFANHSCCTYDNPKR